MQLLGGSTVTFDKLKQYANARIDELISIDLYSKLAPEDATFPYVVTNLSSSSNEIRNRTDWIIDIDFWDNTNNSSIIIAQADLVKAGFNYYWQSETEGFYQSHIVFEGEIPTSIPNMSRIQQRYLLKVR
jgi:hypothetical protein